MKINVQWSTLVLLLMASNRVGATCEGSGGNVTTANCCLSASDFPNTCVIGACGCSPTNSHTIQVCNCLEGFCFNGSDCVDPAVEMLSSSCEDSGGTVTSINCCKGGGDFPNLCDIGPCGCSPEDSEATLVCECPAGECFDGTTCTKEERYIEITTQYDDRQNGCIGLDHGSTNPGTGLLLLPCDPTTDETQWRLDSDGRFHSKVDDDTCMQAGRRAKPRGGTKMRGYPCSNSRLQKFKWTNVSALSGAIKPVSRPSLCVTHCGTKDNNVVMDTIVLKKCR